jgi:SAM-dependent methyltransferase
MTVQTFREERTKRFDRALSICPYARVRELIPLLFLLYRDNLQDCTLVDLASGNGYLADVLEPLVKRIIRVDSSSSMLAACHGEACHSETNVVTVDLREAHTKLSDIEMERPDAMICLAALHHLYEGIGEGVDSAGSEALQYGLIQEWVKLLAPGGRLILVDVCIPDLPLSHQSTEPFSTKMDRYYEGREELFKERIFTYDPGFIRSLDEYQPEYSINQQLQDLLSNRTLANGISLHDMFEARHFRGTTPDRLIPVEFFNNVVANYSIDGHVAFFPSEEQIRLTLEALGLKNLLVTCFPTPWLFKSEAEAVWFVRELFALGTEPVLDPAEIIEHPDYELIRGFIEEFLGIDKRANPVYTTQVNWQLMFAYGEKSTSG